MFKMGSFKGRLRENGLATPRQFCCGADGMTVGLQAVKRQLFFLEFGD